MIGFLKGRVIDVDVDSLMLDVNGVGYEIFCSKNVLRSKVLGGEESFFIYTHVREETLSLFGFMDIMEKRLFLSLLKVNGVGAKMAMAILSGTTLKELSRMIESNDVKGLTRLPKVGKKKAEQIILSLKGKLVIEGEDNQGQTLNRDVASALVNLGFKSSDVEEAVKSLDLNLSVEESVKQGLSILKGHRSR